MTPTQLHRRSALALMGGSAVAGLTGLPAFARAAPVQNEDWAALGADVTLLARTAAKLEEVVASLPRTPIPPKSQVPPEVPSHCPAEMMRGPGS